MEVQMQDMREQLEDQGRENQDLRTEIALNQTKIAELNNQLKKILNNLGSLKVNLKKEQLLNRKSNIIPILGVSPLSSSESSEKNFCYGEIDISDISIKNNVTLKYNYNTKGMGNNKDYDEVIFSQSKSNKVGNCFACTGVRVEVNVPQQNNELQNATAKYEDLKREFDTEKVKYRKSDDVIKSLRDQIDLLQNENSTYAKANGILKNENENLYKKISSLEKENSDLHSTLKGTDQQAGILRSTIHDLRNKINKQNEQLKQYEQGVISEQGVIEQLRSENHNLLKEKEVMQQYGGILEANCDYIYNMYVQLVSMLPLNIKIKSEDITGRIGSIAESNYDAVNNVVILRDGNRRRFDEIANINHEVFNAVDIPNDENEIIPYWRVFSQDLYPKEIVNYKTDPILENNLNKQPIYLAKVDLTQVLCADSGELTDYTFFGEKQVNVKGIGLEQVSSVKNIQCNLNQFAYEWYATDIIVYDQTYDFIENKYINSEVSNLDAVVPYGHNPDTPSAVSGEVGAHKIYGKEFTLSNNVKSNQFRLIDSNYLIMKNQVKDVMEVVSESGNDKIVNIKNRYLYIPVYIYYDAVNEILLFFVNLLNDSHNDFSQIADCGYETMDSFGDIRLRVKDEYLDKLYYVGSEYAVILKMHDCLNQSWSGVSANLKCVGEFNKKVDEINVRRIDINLRNRWNSNNEIEDGNRIFIDFGVLQNRFNDPSNFTSEEINVEGDDTNFGELFGRGLKPVSYNKYKSANFCIFCNDDKNIGEDKLMVFGYDISKFNPKTTEVIRKNYELFSKYKMCYGNEMVRHISIKYESFNRAFVRSARGIESLECIAEFMTDQAHSAKVLYDISNIVGDNNNIDYAVTFGMLIERGASVNYKDRSFNNVYKISFKGLLLYDVVYDRLLMISYGQIDEVIVDKIINSLQSISEGNVFSERIRLTVLGNSREEMKKRGLFVVDVIDCIEIYYIRQQVIDESNELKDMVIFNENSVNVKLFGGKDTILNEYKFDRMQYGLLSQIGKYTYNGSEISFETEGKTSEFERLKYFALKPDIDAKVFKFIDKADVLTTMFNVGILHYNMQNDNQAVGFNQWEAYVQQHNDSMYNMYTAILDHIVVMKYYNLNCKRNGYNMGRIIGYKQGQVFLTKEQVETQLIQNINSVKMVEMIIDEDMQYQLLSEEDYDETDLNEQYNNVVNQSLLPFNNMIEENKAPEVIVNVNLQQNIGSIPVNPPSLKLPITIAASALGESIYSQMTTTTEGEDDMTGIDEESSSPEL